MASVIVMRSRNDSGAPCSWQRTRTRRRSDAELDRQRFDPACNLPKAAFPAEGSGLRGIEPANAGLLPINLQCHVGFESRQLAALQGPFPAI